MLISMPILNQLVQISQHNTKVHKIDKFCRAVFQPILVHFPIKLCNVANSTRVKTHNLFRAVKTALFNVLLPTLFIVVNNIEQHC